MRESRICSNFLNPAILSLFKHASACAFNDSIASSFPKALEYANSTRFAAASSD